MNHFVPCVNEKSFYCEKIENNYLFLHSASYFYNKQRGDLFIHMQMTCTHFALKCGIMNITVSSVSGKSQGIFLSIL